MTPGRVARALLGTYVAGLAVLAVLTTAGPADAHGAAVASWPAIGQTVTVSPTSLTIEFDSPISTRARLQVADPDGVSVADGDPVVQGNYVTQALKPSAVRGTYIADFHVVSADTHSIFGQVSFVVDPQGIATENPAGAPPELGPEASEEQAQPRTAPAEGGSGGGGPLVLIGLAGGVVLLVVLLRVTGAGRAATSGQD